MYLKNKNNLLVSTILLGSFFIRIFGLKWDQGVYLHPDERFLAMVITSLKPVSSIGEYFATNSSTLNPQNVGYQFYVYGYFPIILLKYVSLIFHLDNYSLFYLLGRSVSALLDTLICFVIWLISYKIFERKTYIPMFLYSTNVLAVQLSHFGTVDQFLSFFSLLSLFFSLFYIKTSKDLYLLFFAVFFGFALSSKISAILLLPAILLSIWYGAKQQFVYFFKRSIAVTLIVVFILRLFNPYIFIGTEINPAFVTNQKNLQTILNSKDGYWPPGIQYLKQIRFITPTINMLVWGLGFGLSLSFLLGIKGSFRDSKNKKYLLILGCYLISVVLYHGYQYTSIFRYFYPIYPLVCIISGIWLARIKTTNKILFFGIVFFHLLYLCMFMNIYIHKNTRLTASDWIIKNVPKNEGIANELWDDPLPLYSHADTYKISMLPLYDKESVEKWDSINKMLQNSTYYVMSSNRLWGSIPHATKIYPQTSKFYEDIFGGKSDYILVKKFTNYPGFRLPINKCLFLGPTDYPNTPKKYISFEECEDPGVYLRTDSAEESFSVYDHPQVLIFKRKDGI